MREVEHAKVSKWPKGKSPEDRTKDFVKKHGDKIGRRPARHSGKGYEGREPNYKYWVPIRERVENKVTQRKIGDALAEPSSKGDTDLSIAKKENPPPDWQALREINEGIDTEQKKTGGEKETLLPRDPAQLREEKRRVKKEKYFGRDRFN